MHTINRISATIIFVLITVTNSISSDTKNNRGTVNDEYTITKDLMLANQIDSTYYSKFTDQLEKMFGKNKIIPQKYKLCILIALSFYPELAESKILFVESKISTTLNARPKTSSIIMGTKKEYVIRINTCTKDSTVTIDEVPFNARIGLLGHEFAHFIDYENKSIWGIVGRLLDYSNNRDKAAYEKEIDLMTIKRGLGWQLYHWAYFIQNESDASAEYKKYKQEIYLTPKEIMQQTIALKYGRMLK